MPRSKAATTTTEELLARAARARIAVDVATAELAALTRALREALEGEAWPN